MLYSDVITLVGEQLTGTRDADGYPVPTETKTEIFAKVKSVRRAEFYEALRSGISATIIFEVFAHDYNGERKVEYDGTHYKVERAYQTTLDRLELTCSEVRRP